MFRRYGKIFLKITVALHIEEVRSYSLERVLSSKAIIKGGQYGGKSDQTYARRDAFTDDPTVV
jgi:hypothetical protein